MDIAIIGCSGHHSFALDAVQASTELTLRAVAPGTPGEDIAGMLAACRARGPAPRAYEDYQSLLERESIDLAVVNPWFCDNAKVAADCLLRGLHVYCEKPLATEESELDELEKIWRASGRALGGMFNLRDAPWFLAIQRAVSQGAIGEVRLLHAQKSYRLGRRGMPYLKRAAYGGLLPWVGVHAIDWVLHLGGACEWVCASQSARCNRGHDELEVSAAALLGLQDGVVATVTADYLRPDGSARHDDDRLRVTGTRGMLEAIDGRVFLEDGQAKRALDLPPAGQPFLRFAASIGTQAAARMAEDALAASRVSLLARRAGDEGRVLRVPATM